MAVTTIRVMGTTVCEGHVGAYVGLVIDVTGTVIGSQSGLEGPESRHTGAKVAAVFISMAATTIRVMGTAVCKGHLGAYVRLVIDITGHGHWVTI